MRCLRNVGRGGGSNSTGIENERPVANSRQEEDLCENEYLVYLELPGEKPRGGGFYCYYTLSSHTERAMSGPANTYI